MSKKVLNYVIILHSEAQIEVTTSNTFLELRTFKQYLNIFLRVNVLFA